MVAVSGVPPEHMCTGGREEARVTSGLGLSSWVKGEASFYHGEDMGGAVWWGSGNSLSPGMDCLRCLI